MSLHLRPLRYRPRSPCKNLIHHWVPGEPVWLVGETYPQLPEISFEETRECFQTALPEEVRPPDAMIQIVPLSAAHATEIVALTNLAFPASFAKGRVK